MMKIEGKHPECLCTNVCSDHKSSILMKRCQECRKHSPLYIKIETFLDVLMLPENSDSDRLTSDPAQHSRNYRGRWSVGVFYLVSLRDTCAGTNSPCWPVSGCTHPAGIRRRAVPLNSTVFLVTEACTAWLEPLGFHANPVTRCHTHTHTEPPTPPHLQPNQPDFIPVAPGSAPGLFRSFA